MVQSLRWESLEHRRYMDRLSVLFHIQHGLVDMNTDVIQPNDSRTRGSQRLRQLQASKEVYKYSFYPRIQWLELSPYLYIQTLQGFREGIASLLSSLLHSYQTTSDLYIVLTGDAGYFICFIGHHSFTQGNLRRLLPLQWKKKKNQNVLSKIPQRGLRIYINLFQELLAN